MVEVGADIDGVGDVLWLVYGDREIVGESYWEWEGKGNGEDWVEILGLVEGDAESYVDGLALVYWEGI